MKITKLRFVPFPLMASAHAQTIMASLLPPGKSPPSQEELIDLGAGDCLSCQISIPTLWGPSDRTVVLVHGMGGSHSSSYMIRMSRKLYLRGIKVVRVNLRGCGSGKGLSKLLYHAGTSGDVLKILQFLKKATPTSEISLIGFSLGGNIALKLAGELGEEAKKIVKTFIAICPPFDLARCVESIQEKRNRLYHSYYLKSINNQAGAAISDKIRTLFEFDDLITAPPWGYKGASEYYQDCSSIRFLPQIQQSTHVLFAKDDPFIPLEGLEEVQAPKALNLWVTEKGGHMGYLGKTPKTTSPYWLDHLLLNWVNGGSGECESEYIRYSHLGEP